MWLAELAPVSAPDLVAGVIAQALNQQEQPNNPILETLIAYLKRKHLLLILDNCEQGINEARRVVTAILHDCPQVRVLATSREGLNVAGEHVYRMPSLSAPVAGTVSAEAALQHSAVMLFNNRAVASHARYTFSDENAPYVAEICRRLEGRAWHVTQSRGQRSRECGFSVRCGAGRSIARHGAAGGSICGHTELVGAEYLQSAVDNGSQ